MTLKGPTTVERIEYLGDGVLRFTFDGRNRDIDISALDLTKRYPKLKNQEYLQKAFFEEGCIKWPEGGPWIDADELEHLPETTKFKKMDVASTVHQEKLISALKKIVKSN
jgi:hypothetical protein